MSAPDEPLRPVPPERIPSFNRLLRMDTVRVARGRSEVELTVGEDLTNRRGVTHGGVVASLLDSALGALSSSAVVDFYRPYIAPGRHPEHYVRAGRVFHDQSMPPE